jgi:DNA-binding NtrC family response regulator
VSIAELVFLRGEQSLLHLRLERAEICIGSNPTSDVVVPDPSVPDVAALLIDRGAHRFRLRDLTGGRLTINGKKLDDDEIDLDDGDVMTIGPYELRLHVRVEERPVRTRYNRTAVLGQEKKSGGDALVIYQGERHLVRGDRPFNIGGDEDNDLVLVDEFVSSFHCRITRQGGRWFVSDLESTNGTEVNGLRVRDAELPIPATIRVGRAIIRFELPSSSDTPVKELTTAPSFHGMIAESPRMRRVFELINRLAKHAEPVLIMGESGTGKELVARALHDQSHRSGKPFLALNCGALTPTMIEGELFGHVKGAFTGAIADKPGAFEATDGGTLFLDEIGELPLELQPKLLRVLESKCVRRIGGTKEIRIETRIVAATHRNLEDLVEQGLFREDLFHRLFVLSVKIPPLRERPDDIVALTKHFLALQSPERTLELDASAEEALLGHSWPGNIRELRNIIVRSILMLDGDVITAGDLQFSKDAFSKSSKDARRSVRQLEETERERILEILERSGGNRAEAARLLGMSKSTFHDRLKRYGISAK